MDTRALSKTISHALRHAPWVYELELDDEGWTPLDALLSALGERRDVWDGLTVPDIAAMIAASDKQRFEIDGGRIRAMYGHSLDGKLHRTAAAPPEILLHGTSPKAAGLILQSGLKPMGRQYVHLSADRETAVLVGRRKSHDPVILEILSAAAAAAGHAFYLGNQNVWLADTVAPEFIRKT